MSQKRQRYRVPQLRKRLFLANSDTRNVAVPAFHAWQRFFIRLYEMQGLDRRRLSELRDTRSVEILLRNSFARSIPINGCKVEKHLDRYRQCKRMPSWQYFDPELVVTYVVIQDTWGLFLKTVIPREKHSNHGAR